LCSTNRIPSCSPNPRRLDLDLEKILELPELCQFQRDLVKITGTMDLPSAAGSANIIVQMSANFTQPGNSMNPFGFLIMAAGIFSICGAAFDWDFFMNNRKAKIFVATLGRNGARGVYVVLGVGLAVLGLLLATGVIQDTN